MELLVECYRITNQFPAVEKYSLTQQLRRAVVSVPSNIAEGHGRDHLGDYLRHLSVANGSLMEVETQFGIALRLGSLRPEDAGKFFEEAAEIGRLLAGLVPLSNGAVPDTRHLTPAVPI